MSSESRHNQSATDGAAEPAEPDPSDAPQARPDSTPVPPPDGELAMAADAPAVTAAEPVAAPPDEAPAAALQLAVGSVAEQVSEPESVYSPVAASLVAPAESPLEPTVVAAQPAPEPVADAAPDVPAEAAPAEAAPAEAVPGSPVEAEPDVRAEIAALLAEASEAADLMAKGEPQEQAEELGAGTVAALEDLESGPISVAEERPATLTWMEAVPPHAFLKGAVFGLVVLVPLTALAVYALEWLGIGDARASYYTVIGFVAVFAGVPAIITTGGIGRTSASALVSPGKRGGPAGAIRVAVIHTAVAEIGFIILSVVPLGEVPTATDHWAWIITAGVLAGAVGGFALGLWVRYGTRQP